MSSVVRDKFNPQAFAETLYSMVLPEILDRDRVREHDRFKVGGVENLRRVFEQTDQEEEKRALVEAVAPLAPPDDLDSHQLIYTVVMGAVALRAATPEFRSRYPDPRRRHKAAANWCV